MEKWQYIPGCKNEYMVSSFGRVKSLQRFKYIAGKKTPVNERLLCFYKNKQGYFRVRIKQHNPPSTLVHRLVAIAFKENPNNHKWVNHEDGNKENNKLSNLKWGSISYNIQHAYDNGLKVAKKGEDSYMSKLSAKDVIKIRKISESGKSRKSISKIYSVTPECISHIVLRKTWKHI